jgi:hypothetical protein
MTYGAMFGPGPGEEDEIDWDDTPLCPTNVGQADDGLSELELDLDLEAACGGGPPHHGLYSLARSGVDSLFEECSNDLPIIPIDVELPTNKGFLWWDPKFGANTDGEMNDADKERLTGRFSSSAVQDKSQPFPHIETAVDVKLHLG